MESSKLVVFSNAIRPDSVADMKDDEEVKLMTYFIYKRCMLIKICEVMMKHRSLGACG